MKERIFVVRNWKSNAELRAEMKEKTLFVALIVLIAVILVDVIAHASISS